MYLPKLQTRIEIVKQSLFAFTTYDVTVISCCYENNTKCAQRLF